MAANLTNEITSTDKLPDYIAEAKKMNIPVDPPDVNRSDSIFDVVNGHIVFGLKGIKGMGDTAAKAIVKEREQNGPYKSFIDFLERILLIKEDLTNGHLFEYKNLILCSNGNGKIYVLQKNLKSYVNSSQGYVFESMLWTDIHARCFCEFEGELYFIGNGRLRRLKNKEETPGYFNDTTVNETKGVDAYFLTVADDDSTFMTLKTMVKRGCGIMLKPYEQSSVTVSVIKDRDASRELKSHKFGYLDFDKIYFETFDFRSSKAAEIVPFNSKVKKYSTLQFMVRNSNANEGFGVIGIEKRFVFGNYKKS